MDDQISKMVISCLAIFFLHHLAFLEKILKIIDSTDNHLGNLSKHKSKQTEKFKVQIDTN